MKKTYALITLLLLSFQLRAQVPTNGLVAYYPFNGNANDASGKGNHGTVNGATLTADRFGNANSAYSFDGISNYIHAGSNASLQILGDVTISAWIKMNSLPSLPFAQILEQIGIESNESENENALFTLAITNGGQINGFHENGAGVNNTVSSVSTLPIGIWTHVCIVRYTNSKVYKFYINGIGEPNQGYLYDPTGGTNSSTYIGANPNFPFNGIEDDIRIYNRTLNEAEIQALYYESNWPLGWTPQYSGTGNTLYSVSFPDVNNGSAVGIAATTLHTTDAGNSWSPQTSSIPISRIAFGASFADANTGFMVGQAGNISRTTNGGTNWFALTSGTSNSLYNVHFHDPNVGIAVGALGTILRTTNGGTSWNPDSSGTAQALYGAYVVDANNMYATGGNGKVVYTKNGGALWQSPANFTTNTLYSTSFSSANVGWLTGTNGAIFKTTNGGLVWLSQSSGTTATLFSVTFADANNGFAVGDSGIILRTTNGGTNWTRQTSGTSNTLNSVSFVNASTGWAVGANGTILYTNTGGLIPPTFSVSASDVDFALVPVGTNKTRNVTVTNYGELTLNITSVVTDDTNYTVFPTSASIAPSGSQSFAVKFSPFDTVGTTSHVIFIHNGASSPNTITCTGAGADYDLKGTVYNDHNNNGTQDLGDEGMPGWNVHLLKLNTITGTVTPKDVVVTDGNGVYTFIGLNSGTYIISEDLQSGFLLTAPPAPGTHKVRFFAGQPQRGFDFGNSLIVQFTGPPGGLWSSTGNWIGGQLPSDSDAVELHVPVIYDMTSPYTIGALKCFDNLTIDPTASPLTVKGPLEITNGGSISFDSTSGQLLVCKGDFLNHGEFNAGNSTVVFAGDKTKYIDATTFYNLVILGSNTGTLDNVYVNHTLDLQNPLNVRSVDTVFINNDSLSAISFSSSGIIKNGNVNRKIKQGELGEYFFDNDNTGLKFTGAGVYPTSVTLSNTAPADTPRSFRYLKWRKKGGTVNLANRTITLDSVGEFSKWVIGTQGAGFRTVFSSDDSFATPSAKRIYKIKPTGGNGFRAKLKLHFEPEDIGSDTTIGFLRGPFAVNTVSARWNLVSLPVTPENPQRSVVFPTSTSNAFSYGPSGYAINTALEPGKGYWLKFPAPAIVSIIGDDRDIDAINVSPGWNIIGTPSYVVTSSSVISEPDNIIASNFFGYRSGYFVADTLEPMRGYWVKANQAGKLYLGTSDTTFLQKVSSPMKPLEKLNIITFSDQSEGKQTLYYGANENINPVFFSAPPRPPKGVFDVRFTTDRFVEVSDTKSVKEIPITVSSAAYPLTISWEVKNGPGTYALLIDGKERQLRGKGSVTVTQASSKLSLRLSPIPQSNLPTQYALEQNYPNPFNPTATIGFDIPKTSLVTLKVYNILGQVVTTLLNSQQYDAGSYKVQFNGSNYPSGVYFYRMVAQAGTTSYQNARKMLLVK